MRNHPENCEFRTSSWARKLGAPQPPAQTFFDLSGALVWAIFLTKAEGSTAGSMATWTGGCHDQTYLDPQTHTKWNQPMLGCKNRMPRVSLVAHPAQSFAQTPGAWEAPPRRTQASEAPVDGFSPMSLGEAAKKSGDRRAAKNWRSRNPEVIQLTIGTPIDLILTVCLDL